MPRYPLRDDTRTPAHMSGHIRQPAPAAGPANDPPGTSSTRPPQRSRRSGPGKSVDFSRWQQIPQARQGRKLYAHTHTPAGQRNAGPSAQAAHTRPAPQEKPPTLRPGNIPPGHPRGQQAQAEQPAQKAKRPRPGNAQPQAIQHATHTRPDQFARARARKVLRAGGRSLRVRQPKILLGLGQKNHFPRPWVTQ